MAKFNTTNTIKTENRSGHAAYRMSKKEQLMTAVVNTMFGEEKPTALQITKSFSLQLNSV